MKVLPNRAIAVEVGNCLKMWNFRVINISATRMWLAVITWLINLNYNKVTEIWARLGLLFVNAAPFSIPVQYNIDIIDANLFSDFGGYKYEYMNISYYLFNFYPSTATLLPVLFIIQPDAVKPSLLAIAGLKPNLNNAWNTYVPAVTLYF